MVKQSREGERERWEGRGDQTRREQWDEVMEGEGRGIVGKGGC